MWLERGQLRVLFDGQPVRELETGVVSLSDAWRVAVGGWLVGGQARTRGTAVGDAPYPLDVRLFRPPTTVGGRISHIVEGSQFARCRDWSLDSAGMPAGRPGAPRPPTDAASDDSDVDAEEGSTRSNGTSALRRGRRPEGVAMGAWSDED